MKSNWNQMNELCWNAAIYVINYSLVIGWCQSGFHLFHKFSHFIQSNPELSGSLMPQQPSFLICRNTFNSQFAIRSLIISFLAFSISSNCSLIQLQFVWNQKTAKTDWIEWEMKFKLELEWSQEKIVVGMKSGLN